MQKWEYKEVSMYYDGLMLDPLCMQALNELGQKGWELVTTMFRPDARAGYAFLKRPLPQ